MTRGEHTPGIVDLLPCPFCGEALFVRQGVNPYGRCDTDGCWMNARAISIPLDDKRHVAAWNTRPEAADLISELLGALGGVRNDYSSILKRVPAHEHAKAYRAFVSRVDKVLHRATKARGGAECPGHVASEADKMVCGICGIHINALRPDAPKDTSHDK